MSAPKVVKKLIVEGWRTSCHSYSLVNQHQLLHLQIDPRFALQHRDVPLYQARWAAIDSGFTVADKIRLASIPTAAPDATADVIYRISYPIRVYEGRGRVFVFATSELNPRRSADIVGHDGRPESACRDKVDIITPSSWSRAGLLAAGFEPHRVHVVPHGVDPSLALARQIGNRSEVRHFLGIPEGGFVFLNIGAMTWNKGIAPLLAAFAVHRRKHPTSILVLKASEALYGNLMRDALNDAVHLRQETSDADFLDTIRYVPENLSSLQLASLYGACDAYVSPYRAEGFNLPVLEAMTAGLPVLVTTGGATDDFCPSDVSYRIRADVIQSQDGGYLEPRVDSIVEEMGRVAGDPVARERVTRAASRWAVEQFSWATVTNSLASLLSRD